MLEVKRYVIITFALLMMAFGWTAFLIPNHVLGGGVSGIATLIFYATGISTGMSVFVINAILVLISLKILGPSFGIKTVYSIVVASVFFYVLQRYITEPMPMEMPAMPPPIRAERNFSSTKSGISPASIGSVM